MKMPVLLTAVIIGFFQSCSLKLSDNNGIGITPVMDYDISSHVPSLLRMCYFDHKSRDYKGNDFIPTGGGRVHLPDGIYDILLYNFDLETSYMTGEGNLDSLLICSREAGYEMYAIFSDIIGSYGESGPGTMTLVQAPDNLYVSLMEGVNCSEMKDKTQGASLLMSGENIVWKGIFRFEGLTGAENVSSILVFITNLPSSMYVRSENPSGRPATYYFSCHHDSRDNTITGEFNCFGTLPEESCSDGRLSNELYLLITDIEGEKQFHSFDVTDQLSGVKDGTLRIDLKKEIVIAKPEKGNGIFWPSLGKWDEVFTNINL